jgi:hypothetical protein
VSIQLCDNAAISGVGKQEQWTGTGHPSMIHRVNSIKPPLLVQNSRKTTTLHLRDKIPPDFARFFAKRAKTQFEAN